MALRSFDTQVRAIVADVLAGKIAQVRASWRGPDLGGSEAPLHRHRNVAGGALRAAVFGASDGLVSNVALVLGTAGAHPGPGIVRLAGLAGLLGGAFSMSAGEYVSMSGQREAFERELEIERIEIRDRPESELRELEEIYVDRGISPEIARRLSQEIMADPDMALLTHAREELGATPGSFGSPVQAAASSALTFVLGALVPLIPFLSGSSSALAEFLAVGFSALAAVVVGLCLAHFTNRSPWFSALRSLAICAAAGATTFGIGAAIGVATHAS